MDLTAYSRDQLIKALHREYAHVIHDDFNPQEDPSLDEYLEALNAASVDQLREDVLSAIEGVDEMTIELYMSRWLQ